MRNAGKRGKMLGNGVVANHSFAIGIGKSRDYNLLLVSERRLKAWGPGDKSFG